MTNIRTHVDDNGRILIPAQIRKEFNVKPGDVFVVRVIEGEIHLLSLRKAMDDAQAMIKEYVPEGISLVDELIQIRMEETRAEENKYNNLRKN